MGKMNQILQLMLTCQVQSHLRCMIDVLECHNIPIAQNQGKKSLDFNLTSLLFYVDIYLGRICFGQLPQRLIPPRLIP